LLATRQRATVWLAFAVGSALVVLIQQPGGDQRPAPARGNLPAGFVVETSTEAGGAAYEQSVAATAMRHGLDPALVQAVIEAESGNDPTAVSAKGAIGLMQTLPETAALMGLPEPADPAASLEAGCRYLAALLEIFGGDVELALAGYNAGPGAVRRWGTVPPYRETRGFVRKVGENYRRLTGLDIQAARRFTSDSSAVF
jgi:soluble lytic murein transglycosylase-like protein